MFLLDSSESMCTPTRLYKYLPSQFLNNFVRRGDLLFRNLSFFRQIEEIGRSDFLEGVHMDYPDNDMNIETNDGRVKWKGRAAFLNSINTDRVFVFCLSEVLLKDLFTEFDSDTCVEIIKPEEFLNKCHETISRQTRFSESGLLHKRVEYYAPNRPAKRNVKDTKCIPFFKHEEYSLQQEYRLAVALRGGLKLKQRIINKLFTFDEEVASGVPSHRHVFIGSIYDIVKVHYK